MLRAFLTSTLLVLQLCVLLMLCHSEPALYSYAPLESVSVLETLPLGPNWSLMIVSYDRDGKSGTYLWDRHYPAIPSGGKALANTAGEIRWWWALKYVGK